MDHEIETGPLLVVGVMLVVYFIPTVVAFRRRHPNRWPILIVNFAFGATLIGWFAALIWAAHAIHRPADDLASRGGESGLNLTVNDPVRFQMQADDRGPNSLSTPEMVRRLQKLDHLLGHKAITQAEYDALKAELLKAV